MTLRRETCSDQLKCSDLGMLVPYAEGSAEAKQHACTRGRAAFAHASSMGCSTLSAMREAPALRFAPGFGGDSARG